LIERVWLNQIVTDVALNKQIARLKNDLISHRTTELPIIETVMKKAMTAYNKNNYCQ